LFLVTGHTLPAIHRSSKVIKRTERTCAPIENAVNAIEEKTEELTILLHKYSEQKGLNLNPFTAAFSGVIDAAVNGGVSKYTEAFLATPPANERDALYVERLKAGLDRQLEVLSKGVALHAKLVTTEMQGLHSHMQEAFDKLQAQLASRDRIPTPREKTRALKAGQHV